MRRFLVVLAVLAARSAVAQQTLAGFGALAPPEGVAIGGQDANGTFVPFKFDALGNLNITGSISASNPSVGTNAAAAPSSSTQVGWQDGAGNLQAVSAANPLPVSASVAPPSAAVDAGNSSTTPLGGGGVFLGTGVDTISYSAIAYSIQSDQISAVGGIRREWSQDNVNWFWFSGDSLGSDRTGANAGTDMIIRPHARYFRLRYTNGATPQTYFRLQTILYPTIPQGDTIGIDHAPLSGDDALLTKSVLVGKTTAGGGSYVDVKVNPSGTLQVGGGQTPTASYPNPTDAFNTVALNMGWNGVTWEQIRVEGTNADGEAVTTSGVLSTESYPKVFNGVTWDRVRGDATDGLLVNLGTNNDVVATLVADGVVDAGNSTTTPLGGGATFTGTATDVLGYASISVTVFADQNSAANGLKIQWSNDATNWDFVDQITYAASAGNMVTFGRKAHYYRFVFTNGATPQGTFRAQAILSRNTVRQTRKFVGDVLNNADTGQVVVAALQGHTTAGGGGWVDVKVKPSGALVVDTTGGTVGITGTVGVTQSTTPWIVAGTVTPTDATANPTTTVPVGAFTMGWNGTTWDRLKTATIAGTGGYLGVTGASGRPGLDTDTGLITMPGRVVVTLPTLSGNTREPLYLSTNGRLFVADGADTTLGGIHGSGAMLVAGSDGTNARAIKTDAAGNTITAPIPVAAALDAGTCTNVTASTTVVASNAARKVAIVVNNGTANVHVKLGATATVANPPLAPGQSLTIDGGGVYTGVIDVIASTGTQSVCAYSW